MARYTIAYSNLIERLREVQTLGRLASSHQRNLNPQDQTSSYLCRSAVVLLSSHLEGYVKDLATLTLDRIHQRSICRSKIDGRLLYFLSKDILDEIKHTENPKKISPKIQNFIQRDVDIWKRSGPFQTPIPSVRFIRYLENPKPDKIKSFLSRLGYDEFDHHLKSKLKSAYNSTINQIDHLVDTRNKIAHGDADEEKTPRDINLFVDDVRLFCKTVDSGYGSWCRRKLCSIR